MVRGLGEMMDTVERVLQRMVGHWKGDCGMGDLVGRV